ncbi:MAG: hypothetical protein MW690_000286 [Methanophagales archaeon]|nr:hypothetical protein [Methanophagales archaeon]
MSLASARQNFASRMNVIVVIWMVSQNKWLKSKNIKKNGVMKRKMKTKTLVTLGYCSYSRCSYD